MLFEESERIALKNLWMRAEHLKSFRACGQNMWVRFYHLYFNLKKAGLHGVINRLDFEMERLVLKTFFFLSFSFSFSFPFPLFRRCSRLEESKQQLFKLFPKKTFLLNYTRINYHTASSISVRIFPHLQLLNMFPSQRWIADVNVNFLLSTIQLALKVQIVRNWMEAKSLEADGS